MSGNSGANTNCSTRWRVEELPAWRGYSLEWASQESLLLARRQHIYEVDGWNTEKRKVASFPMTWWQRAGVALRPAQRLLRLMYYNLVPLAGNAWFATFGKCGAVLRDGRFQPLAGLRRPCRVLRGGCAVTGENEAFFGEYIDNRQRDAVMVYRLDGSDGRVNVAHSFPAGSVRHVHGIYRDPFTADLWCLTGDRDGECQMLRSRDRFATIDVVGAGDESWRAVSVQFSRDAIYYATDAEFTQNHLYRIDRRTWRREMLCPTGGPVYYSCCSGADMFFAVTAEICPSQADRRATLWHVAHDDQVEPVLQLEKDFLHKRYFMPGTLHFPGGPGIAGQVFFHAVGLRTADNRLFSVRRAA